MRESSSGLIKQYSPSSHVCCHWGDATLEAATTLGNTLSAAGPMTLTGVVAPLQWHMHRCQVTEACRNLLGSNISMALLARNACVCFRPQPHKRTISRFQIATFMSAATLDERHSWDAQTFGMWEQPSEHICCGECHPITCLRWHEENICLVLWQMHFAHVSYPT